jgi:predicted metalloprotease
MDKAEANALQVRVELQADCLAGVWANHAQAKWQFIEPGDVEAALQTASAIGDDRLQRRTQGYVVPGRFYPRYFGAANALVHDRLENWTGRELRHVSGLSRFEEAIVAGTA